MRINKLGSDYVAAMYTSVVLVLLTFQVTRGLEIRGVDISMLSEVEKNGGKFYGANGDSVDLMAYLAQTGVNLVRLRIWNDPYDAQGNPYGGGNNNYEVVAALAKRVKQAGMKFMLDFHYSDFWADPGKQVKPKAWSALSVSELYTAIYEFTVDILQKLEANGTPPDYVQTGNEINAGMLFPDGADGTTDGFTLMTNFLTSATHGVQQAGLATTPKIVLHLANGCDNAMYQWWFDGIVAANVDFDIIGLSFYPYWHGTLSELKSNLDKLSDRYGKDLMVMETAYGFTLENGDACPNVFGQEQANTVGYPATEDGQATYLSDLKSTLAGAGGGRVLGFVYWEPAWLPGPTWATQQGMSYIGSSGSQGSNWENQALFDYSGKALKGLQAFAN